MAKTHPAKKARFLAGCMGAAGFALTSVAILEDSLVEQEISSSLLQAPRSEAQSVGINSEAFGLQGSAVPAAPQVNELDTVDQQTSVESPQPTAEKPKKQANVVVESDAESDAS